MTADPRTDRLHDALVVVADRHDPGPDAWARIQDRLHDGPSLAEVDVPAAARRPGRTRLLAAAAVVAALAALVAAVLVTGSDDGAQVTTTSSDEAPTGWYIPVGLPDGWSVTSVTSDRIDEECPCRTVVWANADRSQVVIASRSDAPTEDIQGLDVGPDEITEFELGEGVTATRTGPMQTDNPVDARDDWMVDWEADGQRTSFSADGVPVEDAEPISRALFADPMTDRIPVSGLSVIDEWHEDGEVARSAHVDVMMQTPSGNPIDYSLAAPHEAVSIAWNYQPTDRLPGQPLATLGNESGGPAPEGSDFPDMPVTHDYLGRWPGATVRSAGFRQGESGSDEVAPTDAEVETLMASLRPATTAEWRRFVATAGNRDRSVTASATFADLVDGITIDDATSGATTTAAAPVGDLTDLEYSLAAEPRIATWEDAMAVLTVHNPTEATITDPTCVIDRTSVAFIGLDPETIERLGANATGEFPERWSDDGPCDGGLVLEPGATKTVRLVIRAQYLDARYGPLPAGRYLLSAQIGTIQDNVEVNVGPADCTGDASRYLGRTEQSARDLAQVLGDEVRIPEPGPYSDVADQVCNRVSLVLGDDGAVTFARYY